MWRLRPLTKFIVAPNVINGRQRRFRSLSETAQLPCCRQWGTCEESRQRHVLPPPPPVEQPGRTIEVRHEPDVHLNPIDRGEETLSIRVQAEAAIEKLGGHIAEVKGCR